MLAPLFIWGQQNQALPQQSKPSEPSEREDTVFSDRYPSGSAQRHGYGQERPSGDKSSPERLSGLRKRRAAADQDFQARGRSGFLGLIIDNSGSMREKRQGVESAAISAGEGFQSAGRGFHRQFQRRGLPRRRFHQRYLEDGAGADQDRLARRHGHARRHPPVDRAPERKSQARQEGDSRRDRRQRQCQRG